MSIPRTLDRTLGKGFNPHHIGDDVSSGLALNSRSSSPPLGAEVFAISLSIGAVQPFVYGICADARTHLFRLHPTGNLIRRPFGFQTFDDELLQYLVAFNLHSLMLGIRSFDQGFVLSRICVVPSVFSSPLHFTANCTLIDLQDFGNLALF